MKQKTIHFMMLLGLVLSVFSSNKQVSAQELAKTPIGVELIKVPNGSEFPSNPGNPNNGSSNNGNPNNFNENNPSETTNRPNKKVQIQIMSQQSKFPKTGERGNLLWEMLGWSVLGITLICFIYAKKEKKG